MKTNNEQYGFSAVELLITLFVAAAFLISGYQLYAVVMKDSGEARLRAKAANLASDYLQRYKSSATKPCSTSSYTPLTNSNSEPGLSNVTLSVDISCPYGSGGGTNVATGGTITYVDSSGANPRSSPAYAGGYTINTFAATSTLNVTGTISNASVLVVAGGEHGLNANEDVGGTGGYGGAVLAGTETLTGNMNVTVGSGGQNSVFGSRTAVTSSGAHGGFADNPGNNGTLSAIKDSSNPAYYGGGGGGGGSYSNLGASGGLGGGARGGDYNFNGSDGDTNTGGGGGGGGGYNIGGNGGSGIVIIKYPTSAGSSSPLSKILVTIGYGSPQKTIKIATYVSL